MRIPVYVGRTPDEPRHHTLGGNVYPLAGRPAENGLQLEEFLEAGLAPLAPVARLLVVAEGSVEVGTGAIQMHVARAEAERHPARMLDVAGLHVAREPVRRVVRDLDRLLLAVVRQDREDGPEDLLARDGRAVAHAAEHRGAHVV